jgi:hypothetical protein
MKDALEALAMVFSKKESYANLFAVWVMCNQEWKEYHIPVGGSDAGDPECRGGPGSIDIDTQIKEMLSVDPNATRFWYDLDHTA